MIVEENGLYYQLGKITSMRLGFGRDDDILTMGLVFDFGGSGQGLTMALDTSAAGIDYITSIMNVVGAKWVSDIEGKIAYVIREVENPWGSKNIIGIASPAFETGKRFLIKEWLKKWSLEK